MTEMDKCKICRLCMRKTIAYYSLLDRSRSSILETLTSIKVTSEDKLPKIVCIKCWLTMKYAYQTQQNILESDRKLRLMEFQEEHDKVEQVLINVENGYIKREPVIDDNADGNLHCYENIKIENLIDSEVLIICDVDKNILIKQEDSPQKPIISTCKICGGGFAEDSLLDHTSSHYFSRLKCEECDTYCENIKSYRTHTSQKHEGLMQQKWTCRLCCTTFLYKPLYKIHIERAHKKSSHQIVETIYDCPYCKRTFRSEDKSLAHIRTHNKKECHICGIKVTPTNFKKHVDAHTDLPHVCHLCGVTYKNSTSLRSHIHYTHSTRTHICSFCEKVYKKSYDLLLHVRKEHIGEKSHVCDICGKAFFTFYNLNKHKKMTHLKLRPHVCQYCKKKFSSRYALVTHERQHTKITPYSCDVCGEGFRQNVSLKAHKKSKHNIVEPTTCECKVCGKKFCNNFAILSHMRLH